MNVFRNNVAKTLSRCRVYLWIISLLLFLSASIAMAEDAKSLISTNTLTTTGLQSSQTNSVFSYEIYLGAEGTSINDINNKQTTRVQLMTYNHIIENDKTGDVGHWYEGWGIDGFGSVIVTSAITSTATTTTSTNTSVGQAVGGDLNVYFNRIIYKNKNDGDFLTWGPILSLEGLKPNNANELSLSNFVGVRMSYNPVSFLDILYGKNEGVQGRRAELRGQIPVPEVKVLGNPLIVGINVNRGVSNRPIDNRDSIKIYAMWRVPLSSILTISSTK